MRNRWKFFLKGILIVFPLLVVVDFLSVMFSFRFGGPKPWFSIFAYLGMIPFKVVFIKDSPSNPKALVFLNIFIWSIVILLLIFFISEIYHNLINRNFKK